MAPPALNLTRSGRLHAKSAGNGSTPARSGRIRPGLLPTPHRGVQLLPHASQDPPDPLHPTAVIAGGLWRVAHQKASPNPTRGSGRNTHVRRAADKDIPLF
ncbi:hypothetical protein VPH35_079695 [Triticum aestivum]